MIKKAGLLLALLSMVMVGCRSLSSIENEKSNGEKRVFNASKEKVFKSAKETLIGLGMGLGVVNEAEGFISAQSSGGSFATQVWLGAAYGEVIGVWVDSYGVNQSEVTVAWLRKKMMDTGASDWTPQIFQGIQSRLK